MSFDQDAVEAEAALMGDNVPVPLAQHCPICHQAVWDSPAKGWPYLLCPVGEGLPPPPRPGSVPVRGDPDQSDAVMAEAALWDQENRREKTGTHCADCETPDMCPIGLAVMKLRANVFRRQHYGE